MEIKNKQGVVIYKNSETTTLKSCVELAVKHGVSLRDADFVRADLRGADLYDANLYRANLYRANLSGCTYGKCVPMEHEPVHLTGARYEIIILDTHIKIGCQIHPTKKWEEFADSEIEKMDDGALEWWRDWRDIVIGTAKNHQNAIAAE